MSDHVIRHPCEAYQDLIRYSRMRWLWNLSVDMFHISLASPARARFETGSKEPDGGRRDKALSIHITRHPSLVSHFLPQLLSSLYHCLRVHPTSHSFA